MFRSHWCMFVAYFLSLDVICLVKLWDDVFWNTIENQVSNCFKMETLNPSPSLCLDRSESCTKAQMRFPCFAASWVQTPALGDSGNLRCTHIPHCLMCCTWKTNYYYYLVLVLVKIQLCFKSLFIPLQ